MFVIVVIEGLLLDMLVTKILKMEGHLYNLVTKESFEDSLCAEAKSVLIKGNLFEST